MLVRSSMSAHRGKADRRGAQPRALARRDARSDRSFGGPLRSLRNRETQRFGEAGVAPVIHVQPIGRHERFERQMFSLMPMLHQIEAATISDTLPLRCAP